MTIAILVKPVLWKRRRAVRLINQLTEVGVHVVQAGNSESIKAELLSLAGQGRLIAMGGDGTVHLALNALPNANWELAVIPYGTGNDFARHLGLKDVQKARDLALNGAATQIDCGQIELANGDTRRFVGVTSCGFDALVNERANQLRGPQGTLKYLLAVFIELANLRPLQLSVETKAQQTAGEFSLIAIGNCPTYGGGMRICPHARATDGLLNVTYVAPAKRRTLVRVLPTVFWAGHLKHQLVSTAIEPEIAISGEPFLIYADGEFVGQGPARISAQPQAISVVLPAAK